MLVYCNGSMLEGEKKITEKKTQKEPDGNSYMNMTTFAMNFFLNTTIRGGTGRGGQADTTSEEKKKLSQYHF